ncbi:MAG: tetratricopeptide repeat protein [Candidatus Krumholzibacteria bacterium]|nr:tetratricopeptide repeat protein [Candidatus Krumholzibacteria bacterium]MDY0109029.1 tetratricopeptide repeat protein [Candidatus Krumholzibacteria bacterium]
MSRAQRRMGWCLMLGLVFVAAVGAAQTGRTRGGTAEAASGYLRMAATALQAGELVEAATVLKDGLTRCDPTPELWFMLADVYRQQGQLAQAAEAAENAVDLDIRFSPAHLLLGDIFREQGWLQAAQDSYRAALNADPEAPAARYRLIQCLAESGQLKTAEQECRADLARQESPPICLLLGDVLTRQQRLQEALAAFDRTLVLDPRSATAHARRAGLLCQLGLYDEAAKAARAALAIDPDHAEAHGWLGLASAHRQDYLGAYSHAVKAEQAGVDMSAVWSILQRQN